MRLLAALAAAVLFVPPAVAHHGDDPVSVFYRTWLRPDAPESSCCSDKDCHATEIKLEGGTLFARRALDGAWVPVPQEKIEQNRDNPDGRNHLCEMTFEDESGSGAEPFTTVFCFIYGGGA